MKARTQYSDLKGTAAADVNSGVEADKFEFIARDIGLDTERFKIVGVKLYGIPNASISLICLDKTLTTPQKDYIVDMSIENDNDLVEFIFERFSVVLYDQFDKRYSAIDEVHEVRFSEFHEEDEE